MEASSNGRSARGTFGPLSKEAMQALDLMRDSGISEDEAAERLGIRIENVQRCRHILARRPDLEPLLRNGDVSIYEGLKLAGLRSTPTRRRAAGPSSGAAWRPARGDWWEDFRHLSLLYLRGHKTKGMTFAHVPPREAKKRIGDIDEILDLLAEMRADLEPRSHRATSKLDSR